MNLNVDCPYCKAPSRISADLLGTWTKCKACQKEFMFPETPNASRSRFAKLGIVEQVPPPFFRALPWLRRPWEHPLRMFLSFLILLQSCFLLINSTTHDSPSIFIAFGLTGFVFVLFSFLDDKSKLSRVLSISATTIVCCITLFFAILPLMFLFALYYVMFCGMTLFGDKIEFREWFSLAWVPTEVLLILFSVFAVLAFLFLRYGFFRPATVCFLALSLSPATVLDICCEPMKLYEYMPVARQEINMAKHEATLNQPRELAQHGTQLFVIDAMHEIG